MHLLPLYQRAHLLHGFHNMQNLLYVDQMLNLLSYQLLLFYTISYLIRLITVTIIYNCTYMLLASPLMLFLTSKIHSITIFIYVDRTHCGWPLFLSIFLFDPRNTDKPFLLDTTTRWTSRNHSALEKNWTCWLAALLPLPADSTAVSSFLLFGVNGNSTLFHLVPVWRGIYTKAPLLFLLPFFNSPITLHFTTHTFPIQVYLLTTL